MQLPHAWLRGGVQRTLRGRHAVARRTSVHAIHGPSSYQAPTACSTHCVCIIIHTDCSRRRMRTRGLHAAYAGTCVHVRPAADPAAAAAAAADFITLEARLGGAFAVARAASLTGGQYTIARALRFRGQQLLGLLEGKQALTERSPDPSAESPCAPGRCTDSPARQGAGQVAEPAAAPQTAGPGSGRPLGAEEARGLAWVEASDLAANCSSLLLHQVGRARAIACDPRGMRASMSYMHAALHHYVA